MAEDYNPKLAVSSLGGKRSYTLHGIIDVVDHEGAPHHFGLRVMAESKQAARKYLAYLVSDRYPHIGWMLEQTALADGTGAWLPLPDAQGGALGFDREILGAAIVPIEPTGIEIVVSHTLGTGNTAQVFVPGTISGAQLLPYDIWLTVEAGRVRVTRRRSTDPVTAVMYVGEFGVGQWQQGPIYGDMVFEVRAVVDPAGAKFTLETLAAY